MLCAVNERIESGMRLLVPPAYRTQVRFAPGIRWTVCDLPTFKSWSHNQRSRGSLSNVGELSLRDRRCKCDGNRAR